MKTPMTFVTFLRGINVGGNKKVPMADLKKMYEKLGFKNVKTLLASGNVVFQTSETDTAKLKNMIETQFEKTFGFGSNMIFRSSDEIETLIRSNPFKGIEVTEATRLYVTFLSGKPTSKLKIPYESPEKNFTILRVSDSELCSVLTVIDKMNTTEGMNIVEKEYGKNVTTRNWNTILKLKQLAQ